MPEKAIWAAPELAEGGRCEDRALSEPEIATIVEAAFRCNHAFVALEF